LLALTTRTKRTRKRSAPPRSPPPRELREAGLRARKSLGQHFLTSEPTLRRIADAAELSPKDTVIEVGAGLGGLTAELAARAGRVVAIELDAALAERLRQRFAGSNVTVIEADALEVEPRQALAQARRAPPYTLVGNLPYYAAQPIVRHFLEADPPPTRLIVMLQAEVAESMVAGPGKHTLLGISVQLYGEPTLLFRVPPGAFHPPPKVSSAVVRIDVQPGLRADVSDRESFFRIVRAGFSTRRKQIRNALANGLRIAPPQASDLLAAAHIPPTLRAQDLTLEDWAALARAWVALGRPEGAA
jgi:16S rRNA (adenine1518-N6/adenine1519-N6)-dimethyltransferase